MKEDSVFTFKVIRTQFSEVAVAVCAPTKEQAEREVKRQLFGDGLPWSRFGVEEYRIMPVIEWKE